VNWADLMVAQGTFGTDFYDKSILRSIHRAYYRSGRHVTKIGPKGAFGSHEIRPIHSAPSLGVSDRVTRIIGLLCINSKSTKNHYRVLTSISRYCLLFYSSRLISNSIL